MNRIIKPRANEIRKEMDVVVDRIFIFISEFDD